MFTFQTSDQKEVRRFRMAQFNGRTATVRSAESAITGHVRSIVENKSSVPAAWTITIIPDEQAAIEGALNMGQQGDLLLVFADHLTRSWKQITKFRPAGSPEPTAAQAPAPLVPLVTETAHEEPVLASLEGLIRDERGVHFAPEAED